MFKYRYSLEELKKKIKHMEDYLGPILGYSMDSWPKPDDRDYWLKRWVMEYCILLKKRYYKGLKRKNARKNKKKAVH